MALKIKPDEEVILRAIRWLFWQRWTANGNMNGINADAVCDFLRHSGLLSEKVRQSTDPVGRIHYRMQKLEKAGFIRAERSWSRSRWAGYHLTRATDPDAVDIPDLYQQQVDAFDKRVTQTQKDLQQLATDIFPGTFSINISAHRRPSNKPAEWTMSVSCNAPLATFMVFMNLAKKAAGDTCPVSTDE